LFTLRFSHSAKKELKKVDKHSQAFILDSLEDFIESFSSEYELALMLTGKIKKLQAQKEDIYRLKLRSYRVIYKKYEDTLVILVVHVTTREGAYK
jgi:mRNA interferase RelE/StbE